ncbi:EF-hand domain-containing protein [Octadecabacter sp. SW4]|uniref:EF-hand domain-containing protein n=1 Tax=Octadecabacter sp. SW4 TaxID=2602067 RepID=UPI0018D5F0DB|nr:hypothetical protein [Octadecabacter sp. SW4]
MSLTHNIAAATAITLFSAVTAVADNNHHGAQAGGGATATPQAQTGAGEMGGMGGASGMGGMGGASGMGGTPGMGGMGGMGSMNGMASMMANHQMMMQMMMQMHSGMQPMGMNGPGHNAGAGRFPMMGAAMMEAFDADDDGEVSSEEALGMMQSMRSDADSDGDGQLNLQEFETMHTRVMRETMVDRFQLLDADGDGVISEDELAKSVDVIGAGRRGNAPMDAQ